MARVCEICGKGPVFGKRVSHSHQRTPRKWRPNIQKVRALIDGSERRINICTKCLKAGKISLA